MISTAGSGKPECYNVQTLAHVRPGLSREILWLEGARKYRDASRDRHEPSCQILMTVMA
jgi:hypothetical protein